MRSLLADREETIARAKRAGAKLREIAEVLRPLARQALALAAASVVWLRAQSRTPRGQRVMTMLMWFGGGALCIYIGVGAVLYFTQRSLMYFPETARTTPTAAGLPQAEEVSLTTADGEHLVAWHVPPRGAKPVIVYLHGNGGALRYRVERFNRLITDGIGLVAVEYRGYGGSSGRPSERGLIADGEAAYAFAAARYATSQIVLWGESLGSGVAVALASEKPVARVVLESPFTSVADIAAQIYWFLPVRWFIKDPFRSDVRIGKVTAPVLVLHGERDSVVPIALGEQLYALINAPKRFLRFPDGGHNDLGSYGALDAAREFLAASP